MKIFKFFSLIMIMLLAFSTITFADSAKEIEADANEALEQFYVDVKGSQKFLANAKGYLVFPKVKEAGFFLGGKYGEGVLRVNGKTKSFHSITSASMGFQMGLQKYSLVIVFTSEEALQRFIRENESDDEWDGKMDLGMAMAEWNLEEELDDINFGSNMIGFVFDSKGMMGNFSIEGTKFERIYP